MVARASLCDIALVSCRTPAPSFLRRLRFLAVPPPSATRLRRFSLFSGVTLDGLAGARRRLDFPPRGLACSALAAASAILAAACAVPDRPAGLAPPLAEPALAWLEPDTLRSLRVADGVFYRYAWSAKGPWAVHLVSAELSRCDLGLAVVPALADDGVTRARRRVSEMSPPGALGGIAAVNGDFFTPDGSPLGAEGTGATWRSASRPALAWREGTDVWIGMSASGGATFGYGTSGPAMIPDRSRAGTPGSRSDGWQIVGGYPQLLDGKQVASGVAAARPEFAAFRHPRTGVGVDTTLDRFWMVVVDGRQEAWSAGMTLSELAQLMAALGADEALNLDGGGSSAMLVRGRVANRPSDAAGERRVANSLWLVRDPSACSRRRSAAE